jgi:hypothetical protein
MKTLREKDVSFSEFVCVMHRSGGHHPVEAEGGVGVDPRRGNGSVGSVRGGGVPLPHAGVLRRHDRHGHLFPMDQRIRVPQLVRTAAISSVLQFLFQILEFQCNTL